MTKILLVEDDKSLREIYGVRLLAEGYDIISAGDGEEALAMAIKDRPALIVSDVMMPKISGFDMLDILRSTTETRDIKVIMMTALSSEDQRERGESLGADRYLVKSQVGIEDVVRAVHDVLGDVPSASTPPAPAAQTTAPVSFRSGPQGVPNVTVPARDSPAAMPVPQVAVPVAPVAAPAPQPMVPDPQSVAPPPPPTVPTPQPIMPSPPAPDTTSAPAPTLPQPTAPFSTPRPANLGDRVIQPLTNTTDDTDDVADRMAQELSTAGSASTPAIPTPPMAPPAAPSVEPAPQSAAAAPVLAPTPMPVAPPVTGLSFEETPRPPAA